MYQNFPRQLRRVAVLLGSTAIAALVLGDGAKAAETRGKNPASKQTARDATKTLPLSANIEQELRQSQARGKQQLMASLFDIIWREPIQRDAALDLATALAPTAIRDLTTAADLGVLLTGRQLTLAPNAGQVIAARGLSTSNAATQGYRIAPAANNTSPNLPTPLPPSGQQTTQLDLIKAQQAYLRGYTGAGVTVAVGDTGFDTTNQALVNKFDLTRARNYVVNTAATPYDPTFVGIESPTDQHGTHVSGIIAAEKFDNVDMHGVAYNARVVPIRLLLAGANTAPLAVYPEGTGNDPFHDALTYAASLTNVMVYNASYGPSPAETPALNVWKVEAETEVNGVYAMTQAGKLLVVATGNERDDHPVAGRNPSGIGLYPFIKPEHANTGVYDDGGKALDFSPINGGPGKVIAVTAVGAGKEIASYANMCGVASSWCVAAPGGNMSQAGDPGIYSTVPTDTYGFSQGTSMATPVVSGALAVLIQAYPTYSARDLANLLFSTTEDLGNAGLDSVFGQGLIRLDRATDGPTTLAAAANVSVGANTTTYWSQPLTTSGDFTKIGDGVLTVAGRTGAAGSVNVAAGTLAVDGTLTVSGTGNAVNVNTGGTIAGFGTVIGNTIVSGVLAPGKMPNTADVIANNTVTPTLVGNSAGTLTFNGNVTLTSTANTRIDVDGPLNISGGPGTFDKIVVTGAGSVFAANGTLTPLLRDTAGTMSNYTPSIGSSFAFVQAVNGAQTTGSFAALTQPVSGLPANGRFDLIYSPLAITLSVTPASFAALSGTTPLGEPGSKVAAIIDAQRPAPGAPPSAGAKALYDALYALNSPAQYATALGQLGGAGTPALTSASMVAFQGFMGSIGDRQEALASGAEVAQNGTAQSIAFAYGKSDVSAVANQASQAFASVGPAASSGWSVWAQGFGRWSNVGDAGGLSGSNSRSGGFVVGADTLLSADLIGGMAVGFARTTSDATGSRATSDSYTGALYASWTPGRAIYDVRVAAGPTQIRTTRDVNLAPAAVQGDAKGFGAGVNFEAGYRIPMGAFIVKPYAGIAWQGFQRDGYSESQAPFGLTYASQYFEKVTTTLGAAFSTTLRVQNGGTLLPEVKLGWGHDLRDTSLVSQAALLNQAFFVNGASPGRDAALVGLKLSGWTRENFKLFVAYNGEFRSNATSHQLSGGARYSW